MIENIKIMTRSFSLDYDTFNVDKFGSWWENYKDFYNDESNGVYIEIEDGKWSIFIDKINSNRRDNVGNPGRQIYFALEGSGEIGNDDYRAFLKLIFFFLTKDQAKKEISSLFNSEFPAEFINLLDKQRHTDETDQAVKQKLNNIFAELPEIVESDYPPQKNENGVVIVKKYNDQSVKEFLSRLLSADKYNGKTIFVYTDSYADEEIVQSVNEKTSPNRGFFLSSQEGQEFEGKVKIVTNRRADYAPITDKKKAKSTNSKKLSIPLLASCALNLIFLIVIFVLCSSKNSLKKEYSDIVAKNYSDSLTISCQDSTIMALQKKIDELKIPCFSDSKTHNVVTLDLAEFSKTGVCKMLYAKNSDTVSVYSIVDFDKNSCKVSVCKGKVSKGGADVNLK